MERYICIHGHFYQPPRENPWLEEIEIQDSSYPYHDWNERITSECYAPNSASRLLDGEGRIIDIVSNYANISFNLGTNTYSLMHLFREEQRKILSLAINETMEQFEHAYRLLYENNRTLMAFLHEAGMPVPEAFRTAAAFTLNLDLKRACSAEMIDSEKIRGIITEINKLDVSFDSVSIEFMLRRKCEGMIGNLCGTCGTESELSMISDLHAFIEIIGSLSADLNYWQIQNIYYKMAKTVYREFLLKAKEGDSAAVKWLDVYRSIGEKLSFNTASVLSEN